VTTLAVPPEVDAVFREVRTCEFTELRDQASGNT
jgi:hypothetical protein